MGKLLQIIIVTVLITALLCVGAIVGYSLNDAKVEHEVGLTDIEIPQYSMVDLGFVHAYEQARGLPYAAGAILDIDNDGTEEIFLGGGVRQADGFYHYVDDHFVNVVDQTGFVKQGDDITLGAAVIDMDSNGYDDLIISRESGLYLYYNNEGVFSLKKLDIEFPAGAFPLGVAITDLNDDGFVDFFVPIVRRAEPMDWLVGDIEQQGIPPRLYINDGEDNFSEITEAVGISDIAEARQIIFADLDNDGLDDITMLHTNGTLSTWKNLGDLLFENRSHFHTSRKGYYTAMAAGDYDNNGDMDFFIANRGSTHPAALANLLHNKQEPFTSEWIVMKNSGFFTFKDGGADTRLAGYEIGRGAIFADLNNDGRNDLVVSQNHPYWPPHILEQLRLPGRIFVQNMAGEFGETATLTETVNKSYGVTPLRADFNNDGYVDIVNVNMGERNKVFLSKAGNNNYLKIKLPGSSRSLGADILVKTVSGTEMKRTYQVGGVLCSDSSHIIQVGLGQEKVTDVLVQYRDGTIDHTSGVLYNTIVTFE
ncbi:MAG: VCBS repeat-containing protein [Desulfocapsaceae bacterium]|nr:VCBS repeat-containing protein [Desulfocapsaceae bacterium]